MDYKKEGVDLLQVCVLAMAGVFSALIIKKDKPEFATLIILLTSFFIAMKVLGIMEGLVKEIDGWTGILSENVIYIKLMLKLIGITYICDFAANLCRDSGHGSLGNHIELFGKISIMAAGFPVIKTLLDMLEGII